MCMNFIKATHNVSQQCLGMLLMKRQMVSWGSPAIFESEHQSSRQDRLWCNLWMLWYIKSQSCSIGFRSGEHKGLSVASMSLSSRNCLHTLTTWGPTLGLTMALRISSPCSWNSAGRHTKPPYDGKYEWTTCATWLGCRYCLMLQIVTKTLTKHKTRDKSVKNRKRAIVRDHYLQNHKHNFWPLQCSGCHLHLHQSRRNWFRITNRCIVQVLRFLFLQVFSFLKNICKTIIESYSGQKCIVTSTTPKVVIIKMSLINRNAKIFSKYFFVHSIDSTSNILPIRFSSRRHKQHCYRRRKLFCYSAVESISVLWPHIPTDICKTLIPSSF